MPITDKTTLKGYFTRGKVPNESNYVDLIDSFAEIGSTPGSNVTLLTTNFNNNLSAADDTVQKALDTIDNFNLAFDLTLNRTWTGIHTFQSGFFARLMLPETHNTYDIGDDTKRWRNGQFQGGLSIGGLYVGAPGTMPSANTISLNDGSNVHAINGLAGVTLFIDGGTAVITTGDKLTTEAPYSCAVLGWVVTSSDGTSGSLSATIQKISYANFPGGSWTTIASPSLSSTTKNYGTLSGQTLASGDIIKVNISSVSLVKKIAISLKVRKT